MSRTYGDPRDAAELEAYYDAKNNAVNAARKKKAMSPQDRVITVWTTDPDAIGCCPPRPVPAPTGPISLSVASGSALLSWSYTDTSQEGFYVQKSVDTGSTYVTIANLPNPFIRAYTDTLVYENNGYWYRVNAYNATSVSNYSNTASIFFPADAPSGPISLSVASGSAILSWSFVYDYQDGFNIERTQDGGSTWAAYDILASPHVRSYTDAFVSESNAYWYRINAYNVVGTSSYSNTATINFPFPPPSGPISLSLESGSAILNWTYTDTNQDGWYVYKSWDGVVYVGQAQIETASARTYTDVSASIGNTYWYQVSAYNTSGSILSNTASITFPIPIPSGPISLSVASGSSILSWSYVDDGQDGFNVERSTNGIVYAQFYALSNSFSRSYTDVAVTAGNTYWYRINAFNQWTASEYSNTASIEFILELPISLSVASGSAVLSWVSGSNNQDYFVVQKSLDGITYSDYVNVNKDITTNGGFESGDFTGWTMVDASNSTEVTTSGYVHDGVYGVSAGPWNGNTGSLTQVLTTGNGKGYTVSFWLSASAGDMFQVWWDGNLVASLTSGSGDIPLNWTHISYSVTASGPTSSLQFLMNNEPSFFALDSVTVEGVVLASTYTDTNVSSSMGGTTYWYQVAGVNSTTTSSFSNTASITFTEAAPPPPPPMAPIFLEVFSGSAILVWDSGSNDADFWSVHKSDSGPSGSYSEVGTTAAEILTLRDTNVQQNQTYYYKVAAVNTGGTSSFSNVASIHVRACEPTDFNPIVYAGYVTNQDISNYRNTYGVSLPFTTSAVSQSISVWGRSQNFDVYLTLVDSAGNVLIENQWDGWVVSGDTTFGNAAFTYTLPSGSYTIELSSYDNAVGSYLLYISPGGRKDTEWPNGYETATCEYIPTSNCIVVGEQGSNVMWYHVNTDSMSIFTPPAGVQGIAYSPQQDRVFAWVYYGNGGAIPWTASIVEFDNTGSLVGATHYPRPVTVNSAGSTLSQTGTTIFLHTGGAINDFTTQAESGSRIWFNNQSTQSYITSITNATTASVLLSQEITYDPDFFDFGTEFQITRPQITPNVDFSGYMTYDPKHDRIAFYRYFYATNHIFNIFDVPTRTITASLNAAPYTKFYDMWEGCYSWADDCFYIATTTYQHMVRVNASTFSITSSAETLKSRIISSYASSSGLLMLRNNSGKVVFADPISQSVVYTRTDLPSSGLFEGTGKSGDPADDCTNVYALTIDTQGGPNVSALALLDKDTYRPQNYLALNSDNPGGFAPDGWYQYSIAFNNSNSRVYSAQVDYDTYTGRLYSIRLSRAPLAEYLPPYTASAITASCIAYDSYFYITGSNATESTYWIGRANPQNVCVSQNPAIPVLMTSDNSYWLTDFETKNRNNWFFNTVTHDLIANYSQSYLQNWCGKSAVFGHNIFVTMDAVTGSQPAGYDGPINGVNILALSPSGSVLNTFPLTYNGRDYDIYTDADRTSSVEILQIDAATTYLYVETYSPMDYSSFGPTAIRDFLIGGYPQITASATYSFDGMGAFNEYYWGKVFIAPTTVGGTNYYTYINLIPSASTGFAGDTLTTAYGGYIHYSPSANGQLNMGISPYAGWGGSFCYFPITDRIYLGVYKEGSFAPMVIETDKALQVQYTYDLSQYTGSNFLTPDEITYDRYNNSLLVMDGYRGTVLVIDPVAHTVVCLTDAAGSAPSGYLGSQNTAVGRDGKIYIAQQRDGGVGGLTGSIKIYQA